MVAGQLSLAIPAGLLFLSSSDRDGRTLYLLLSFSFIFLLPDAIQSLGGETFGNYMGKHLAIFLTLSAHYNASFRTLQKSSKSPKTQGIVASYRQFPLPLFVIRLGLLVEAGDMRWNGEYRCGGGAWGNIWMVNFA